MNKHSLPRLFLAISFLFFAGALAFFLQNDFWQDEVYTLFHFVFVPLHTTITDYHSTNNHVLFSVLNNIARRVLNLQQLSDVLLHPYLLRSIPAIISLFVVFIIYKKTKDVYGRTAAIVCSSILVTTFPLLCFATQFRGYSLSVFIITLQYFSFAKTIQTNKSSLIRWLVTFLFTSLSLLCLPTNIYIELSYLLLCFLLFVKPSIGFLFFKIKISKRQLISIASAIIMGCLWTSLYYRWMLQQQPQNEFISTFQPFAVTNLLQSFSIIYHFTGYRFYLILIFITALVLTIMQLKKKAITYCEILLPTFLFFVPFLFFFVHGAIIIQRTFLSLIPFFVLLTGLSVTYFLQFRYYSLIYPLVLFLNLLCIIFSFGKLVVSSKENNVVQNHQQDLVQHYYLFHFNELQSVLQAKKLTEKTGEVLYLRDGFGQTGIDYYLNALHVPFVLYNDTIHLPDKYRIITNEKIETEHKLRSNKTGFIRYFSSKEQYNIFESNRYSIHK